MATTANKNCKQFTGVVLEEITAREGDVPGKGKVTLKTVLYDEDEDENRIEESGSTEIEVFNRSTSAFAENEEVDIWQDGYGIYWVTITSDYREKFIINYGKKDGDTPTHTPSIFTKGSLHYIVWDNSKSAWVPSAVNEASSSSTSITRPSGSKLAICQEDAPNSAAEYHMPYYTPEDNLGVPPNYTSSVSIIDAGDRCGVKPGEHSFTDKCYDYRKLEGSYIYEPQFTATVQAQGQTGGNNQLYIDINNEQYECVVPQYHPTQADNSGPSYPDIYPYDYMVVSFDCETYTATGLDYPRDYPEGTIMPWFRPNPWSSPIPFHIGRGWVQYVPSGGQGEITAVNIDKTSSHYDSSSDCVWVEAGANDKIPVKEGCLCFVEKVKTNAIV